MLFNGIKVVEGSEIQSAVVQSGPTFSNVIPAKGELFYISSTSGGFAIGLYVYDVRPNPSNPSQTISSWKKVIQDGDPSSSVLPPIVTPSTYKIVTVNNQGLVTSGTNPSTLAGFGITDAQPLNSNLTAIAGIVGSSGILRKTGTNTWALDTNTYLTSNQTITIGGDVSGSGTTAFNLALTNTGVGAGTYGTASAVGSFQVDAKGRIIAASSISISINASAVTAGTFADNRIAVSNVTQHQAALTIQESQITDSNILARVSGNETVTGAWTFANPVAGAAPTQLNHFATRAYVDNIASGVQPLKSVRCATTSAITLFGIQTIDGINLVIGDRILVKDQSNAAQNGIYDVTNSTWTRASDFDGNPTSEVSTGSLVFVESGTANGNSSWILVTTGSITVGITPLTFSVFSRAGDYIAGNGLTRTGNTFNVVSASASRINVTADAIDLATTGVTAGTYSMVTVDTYGRVTSAQVNQAWANISGSPTTLSGYGISDGQPSSPTLTAISGISGNGILVKTGVGTAAARTITVSGNGLTISNGDGIGGNISISSNAVTTNTPSTIVYRDASGNFSAGNITATLSGNASTATTLATGRTFTVTGDASGTSAAFNGSANVSIPLTLANVNSNLGTFAVTTVNAKGLVTAASALTVDGDVTGVSSAATLTLTLSNTTVTPGSYGSAASIPTFTVDSKGRITGVNAVSVQAPWAGVTGKPTTLAGYGITDGQQRLTGTGLVRSTAGTITYDTNAYITANQNITLSGDATGSGSTSISVTLANSGVAAGTYGSSSLIPALTVDAKGRVVSGIQYAVQPLWSNVQSKPTTLAGYGITDAVSSSSIGTIAAQNANNVNITGGSIATTGLLSGSVATNLTATGSTLAAALGLTRNINHISTGTVNTGVRLPNSVGSQVIVINATANNILVYPFAGTAQIDSNGNGTATTLPPNARIMFIQISSTQYYTLNATYA